VHIVTQFGFNPEAVRAWHRHLAAEGIALPVHVGIAGPTPVAKLIKLAVQCGVGTSMHTLRSMGSMANLARWVKGPEEMLAGLARGGAADPGSGLVQPHFYAFGGILATSRWLRTMTKGDFQPHGQGERCPVQA
jgi:methylenetetrahydrofolate reductase (NADPH)